MTRGFGEVAFVQQLPDAVTLAFGFVTQLGDVWFLTLGAFVLYWYGRNAPSLTDDALRTGTHAVALLLGAYTLTLVLKTLFGLPRPPGAADAIAPTWLPTVAGPAYASLVTGHGFGFPSGHALTTTVVYGGLATTLRVWNARKRAMVVGLVVGLVALSRVVLGVHYVVDVVVGVAVGLGYLWMFGRFGNDDPVRSFVPAIVFGAIAFPMTGSYKALAVVAVSVAGVLAWRASVGRSSGVRADPQ